MQNNTINHLPLTGIIRQLRPSDLPRFREHLLRLDAVSRRDRFNGATDDDFIASYADRSFAQGTTVIGYVEDDKVFGAAELHERPEIAEPTGEIAFSVERHLQHRHIGGRLFERLIANARGLGYTKLLVTTHPQNVAMKALARKFNAALSFEDGETVGVIDLGQRSFAALDLVAPKPFGLSPLRDVPKMLAGR
ncbi:MULTISPECIES: GNAT family N-acetyltransferase [unclassified Mesorhizobium]|uniref:GNAT family N-acetyltransferase n=1 Tax=unclassified Mesorhizobium TaxID=325217 RepID=UPI00301494A0